MDNGSLSQRILFVDVQENSIKITTTKTENCDNKIICNFYSFLKSFCKQNTINVKIDISKITALNLSHCQLTDLPIPYDIINLKQFIIAHNNLAKVPSCVFTYFKQLEILDISHNQITLFDIEPASLTNLKKIKLNNNKFENVPKWFLTFRAVNLEEFNYSMNKASHYNYLKNSYNLNFLKLRKLKLKNCHLIDADFNFLRCFHYLVYLDISNATNKTINKFYEIDELFIKTRWKQLEILKMNRLSIAMFPEGIAWLEYLVELHFKHNNVSWLPNGIEFLINLKVLDVSNNELIGIPDKLCKLQDLEVLKLPCNWIQTAPDFKLMSNLMCLDLYDNMLEDISFNINKMKYIDLEQNYVNTNRLDCMPLYKDRKENYRKTYQYSRCDGFKEMPCEDSSSSGSSSDNEEYTSTPVQKGISALLAEDNWDPPLKQIRQRNPDIDSEDDNWDDEVISVEFPKKDNIYVEDEEWMFEDVNEEC